MVNKICCIALGAAGNKALVEAINAGVVEEKDAILINSTSKDFPESFSGKKIIISPNNTGCGKERNVSKAYLLNSIKEKVFEDIDFSSYSTICLVSSVEGGTGSGSTPLLANYVSKVLVKNVHIWALTGFASDVRGLANTVEFFKDIDSDVIVHTISNAAFLNEANQNTTIAEELANKEFTKELRIMSGQTIMPSDQNIDDTDIIKLANTYGYSYVEYKELDKSLGDSSDYDKIIKRMIYDSKALRTENPCATRVGVILNLTDSSRLALGDVFAVLKESFGMPYECFKHIQYDGKKEYIAFIASGMKLPIEELTRTYEKYLEQTKLINKQKDSFFDAIKELNQLDEDKKFDMIQPVKKGMSTEDFLSKL